MKPQFARQGGFTLIELMIVITIIGILAAVAVPAYLDYTIRARVGECSSLFGSVKTGSSLFYNREGKMPPNVASLGYAATDFKTDFVAQIEVDSLNNNNVECKLENNPSLGDSANDTVVWTAATNSGALTWRLNTTASTVEDEHLP